MQLILAIDSDRRRADQLASLVRSRLTVDLVQATSAGEGLQALQDRVPDLILTSPLLSPFDDGVLDEYLRDLGAAAAHVQTLRIPVLSVAPKKASAKRLFSLGRKKPTASSTPEGCDPTLFADEIALYLTRAAEERQALSARVASAEGARAQEAVDSIEPLLSTVEPSVAEPVDVPEPMYQSAPVTSASEAEHTSEIYSSERVTYSSAPPLAYSEPAPEPIVEERLVAEEPLAFEEPLVVAAPLVLEERLIVEDTFVVEKRPEPVSELATPPAYAFEAIDPVDALPIEMPQEPEPVVAVIEAAPVVIEPLVVEADHVPEPAAKAKRPTASFEAALAAIRAAWAKPGVDAAIVPEPAAKSAAPATESPAVVSAKGADVTGEAISMPAPAMAAAPATKAPTAPAVEVDLTGEIDALESTIGGENPPAIADEPSAEEPQAPATAIRGRTEKNKKRPEKGRGRKLRGADGRPVQDEWGMFDPNQCGFSALVNKLDEVTEPDEAPPRAGTTVRVISFG
ncbi:MAG TPA: hypothetical protein VI485_18370 [Vicinamibacterales bacterium]|nr:hypothetical protein [Vicinamibacterales bacterium]